MEEVREGWEGRIGITGLPESFGKGDIDFFEAAVGCVSDGANDWSRQRGCESQRVALQTPERDCDNDFVKLENSAIGPYDNSWI